MYDSMQAFQANDMLIRKQVKVTKEAIRTHIIGGLELFHTDGNYNVAILNTVILTAKIGGYQVKRVAEWVEVMCGHKLIQDKGEWRFTSRKDDVSYDDILAAFPKFIEDNPFWLDYKKPTEEELFNLEAMVKKDLKHLAKVQKACEDAGLDTGAEFYKNLAKALDRGSKLDGFYTQAQADEAVGTNDGSEFDNEQLALATG